MPRLRATNLQSSAATTTAARLPRRQFLGLLAATASITIAPSLSASRKPEAEFRQIELRWGGSSEIARRALVLVPMELDPTKPHPALVLLHGYAHALMSQDEAIAAWKESFAVMRAYGRLCAPPVSRLYQRADYLSEVRQLELNQKLSQDPFQGLILVCPYTPIPYFCMDAAPLYERYADWMERELLPTVRTAAPVAADARCIGLAGVSMGGQVGLELMVRRPELFGAFTGIQAAIKRRQAYSYAVRLKRAQDRAGSRPIQIITSVADRYRFANEELHRFLQRRAVTTELKRPAGPHTSKWMREIGALETLLWHDRVLHPHASHLEPALP